MSMIPSNTEIHEIAVLAGRQLYLEERVVEAEQQLKAIQAQLKQVQEVDLPGAMAQAGVQSITLPTGQKITIKEDVYASIPKDERYHEALDWMREHGYGDLIKNEVKVAFGKGEEPQALELIQFVRQHNWGDVQNNISVHASTLKSMIREVLAKGVDIPMELFGAYPVTKAIIK